MNPVTQALKGKFAVPGPLLDERTRRLRVAVEARSIGRGGVTRVAEATGMSRGTVRAGLRELDSNEPASPRPARLRRSGAGRKALAEHDSGVVRALERQLDPLTRGDPMGRANRPAGRGPGWRELRRSCMITAVRFSPGGSGP